MKWGPNNHYKLPGDPGFLTRLWWAIEDRVRFIDDVALLGLLIFALVLLWLIIAYAVLGPF